MRQLRLGLTLHDGARMPGYGWIRQDMPCGANYLLTSDEKPTGWSVRHCGHPTAQNPYYLESPTRTNLGGRLFRYLHEAKDALISAFEEP